MRYVEQKSLNWRIVDGRLEKCFIGCHCPLFQHRNDQSVDSQTERRQNKIRPLRMKAEASRDSSTNHKKYVNRGENN